MSSAETGDSIWRIRLFADEGGRVGRDRLGGAGRESPASSWVEVGLESADIVRSTDNRSVASGSDREGCPLKWGRRAGEIAVRGGTVRPALSCSLQSQEFF